MRTLNTLLQFLLRILVVLIVFQICRLLFISLNKSFYPDNDLWDIMHLLRGGLKYDLAACFIINIPYLFLMFLPLRNIAEKITKEIAKILFVLINLTAISLNIIDIFYFPYTLDRLSINFLQYLETQKNMGILLWRFLIDYWYALFVFAAFIFLIVCGYNCIGKVKLPIKTPFKRGTILLIYSVAVYLLMAAATASWIPVKLLKTDDSWAHAKNPLEVVAVTNTPFNIIQSIFFEPEIVQPKQLKEKYYQPTLTVDFKKKNVVVFILESFTKEASGFLNSDLENGTYKGYIPFLDSLMQQSYYFTNAYANGRRSIDAVPAILASVPAIQSGNKNSMISIASLLKEVGYKTQFFHGAHNGSMDFDQFCKSSGIDEYYGLTEFNNINEFDGTWGIWDEPFLQFMLEKQSETPEPFCSTVFTLSSHNPYVLPEKYEGKFNEGIDPICKCISYADYSIRNYFRVASTKSWFNNTIFVFTADHAIIPWHKEYSSPEQAFAIPLFFYTPGEELRGESARIAQHIDILPSILAYLNYPSPFKALGNNLLDKESQEWAINAIGNIPQLIEKDNMVTWYRPNGTIMNNPKSN